MAGLDLDLDDEVDAGIVPGVGAEDDDDDEWQDETYSPRKQDDLLARLRRRILYRQQDAGTGRLYGHPWPRRPTEDAAGQNRRR